MKTPLLWTIDDVASELQVSRSYVRNNERRRQVSEIRVHVQLGRYPSRDDITVVLPVDDIQREGFEQIKVSDSSLTMFDTPSATVRIITKTRQGMAAELTAAVMQALETRDTFNGYTRADREKML